MDLQRGVHRVERRLRLGERLLLRNDGLRDRLVHVHRARPHVERLRGFGDAANGVRVEVLHVDVLLELLQDGLGDVVLVEGRQRLQEVAVLTAASSRSPGPA